MNLIARLVPAAQHALASDAAPLRFAAWVMRKPLYGTGGVNVLPSLW